MRKILDQLNVTLLVVLMLVMVLSAVLQVLARVINLNVQFTEELTIYSMMWVTLFGAGYTFGLKKHIAIDLFSTSLADINKKRLKVVIDCTVILFSTLILIIGGLRFVWITFKLGQVSSVMHVPKGWVYLALPVSGIVIVLYSILNIVEELKRKKSV